MLYLVPYEAGDARVVLRFLWTFIGFPVSIYVAVWYIVWVMQSADWIKGAVGFVVGLVILLLGLTLADFQLGSGIFMALLVLGAFFGIIARAVYWVFKGRT